MMTSTIWQFPHTFWNGGTVKLTMDNTLVTLEKKMLKQKGKWTWKKSTCEKGASIKKKKNHVHTYT
jgi:hypothetical protein